MSVKIVQLEAENVKRIKAVQLTPAPTGLTVIGGNNNQGKTSVLDAIAWALGGEKFRPDAAARVGAVAPPHLKVTLSNGLVAERKGKNSALTVTDPAGRRAGQQLLNEFVEALALDLPRFMNAGDREKADTLLKIIGVGEELADLDRQIKAAYDRRTALGQIAAQKKAYADEMQDYPDAPAGPVSAADLIRRQQEILARNAQNAALRRSRDEIAARQATLKAEAESLKAQIEALTARFREKEDALAANEKALADAERAADGLADESTAALEAGLREVEETNRKVRANLDKARAEDDAAALSAEYDALTGTIADLRRQRTALLEGAALPLPGLSVEDGALTYFGKRWGDMSGSDQLRVAAAIVGCLNPNCGFVLLDKLEQMDAATLAEFGSWLEEQGLQAIATRVSTGGECQIIIEDGRAADPAPQAPSPTKTWRKGAF